MRHPACLRQSRHGRTGGHTPHHQAPALRPQFLPAPGWSHTHPPHTKAISKTNTKGSSVSGPRALPPRHVVDVSALHVPEGTSPEVHNPKMLRSPAAFLAVALAAAASVAPSVAIDNGLGITPPRGWRSWNQFDTAISQDIMEAQYAALVARTRLVDGVATSLLDLGYNSAGIDDGWQKCNSGPGGVGFHNATGYAPCRRYRRRRRRRRCQCQCCRVPGWAGANNQQTHARVPLLHRTDRHRRVSRWVGGWVVASVRQTAPAAAASVPLPPGPACALWMLMPTCTPGLPRWC